MDRERLAALHGVDTTYRPAPDRVVRVPEETVVAVLAALGVDASTPQAVLDALAAYEHRRRQRLLAPCTVVRTGRPLPLGLPAGTRVRIEAESGEVFDDGAWERIPLGRHVVRASAPDGRTARADLVIAPERLPGAPGRTFGFMAQLYSTLSERSWGMGDLGDLADLAAWSGRALGAGFLQINPLHIAVPGQPTDPSPYRPSSRRFPDPVYLRVEDVPEYAYLEPGDRARAAVLTGRAAALRAGVLHKDALIDRDAVWELKLEALGLVRKVQLQPGRRAEYVDFLAEQGQALDDHATWCALAEVHGPDWHAWPAGLRDPRSAQVARVRSEQLDRVDFYCWLTWLTDDQLRAAQSAARSAGMPVGIVHDLAVGVHPSGSDAWAMQDALARGMSVGAPPDAFNSRGQDWGLPPWRPDALAATGYTPYRDLLARLLRHAGALRIDHVMGLFRLWWVPEGRPPTEGAYVRYDAEAMLGVLALEAHRAGAVVIGEDLGTVEAGVREELADRGILGTSVLWFERHHEGDGTPLAPGEWRPACLATVTTHDLPSTAARLTGEHVELRHRLGLLTRPLAQEQAEDAAEVAEWITLLGRLGLLPEGAADEEAVVKAVHRFLARTPAAMVGIWLPDAVGDRRPQNLPGTWDQYPNWRLPVADAAGRPVTLEQLAASPRLYALLDEVRAALLAGPGQDIGTSGPGQHMST
ncbi:4-alpha-glucanotransferase [Streptomyces sp. H10-C2]|uniref:4-alpha-glucanotransferase n=1 Tax=unclassified Streptomyces TaxID=2593676 RepID=UPI0024BA6EF2|nr:MULTISPECIES: 4-alpha-glucanotransferase [unclassified Streptomyces]MDJ0340094.1 4-alpha-glucanotransferase [Streptomyces sp. PH10-H1]MDJ0369269.1 4-alpha-glucanotransferase [Streptomyces sp. H10-C2]